MNLFNKVFYVIHRLLHDAFVNGIASSFFVPQPLKYCLYKIFGLKIKTMKVRSGCLFNGKNIEIGEGTFVNYRCYFDNTIGIKIGKKCAIGMEVLFCTSSHEIGESSERAGKNIQSPIIIGDGCWIGARAQILPGVKIGNGCVIAAGSIVTKDCEPNGLYMGTPARRIRDLPVEHKLNQSI